MKETKSVTKDPICGMTVDEATALHAEHGGKTFYFCSDHFQFIPINGPARPLATPNMCSNIPTEHENPI